MIVMDYNETQNKTGQRIKIRIPTIDSRNIHDRCSSTPMVSNFRAPLQDIKKYVEFDIIKKLS